MILKLIPLLTSLIFAAVYPLCFWIHCDDPLKNNFHRFHIGLPTVVGGISVMALYSLKASSEILLFGTVWMVSLLAVTFFSWKKETVNPFFATVSSVLGLVTFAAVQHAFFYGTMSDFLISMWSGFILCLSLYAMNLGHWYLNVYGLPVKHLLRTVNVFWSFLTVRALWDIYQLFAGYSELRGNFDVALIPLKEFVLRMDGIFVWVGILFGIVLPITALYCVRETLKVKSTQAATGILYVILISVLIGDMTFKYYLLKFGVPL